MGTFLGHEWGRPMATDGYFILATDNWPGNASESIPATVEDSLRRACTDILFDQDVYNTEKMPPTEAYSVVRLLLKASGPH